jgi:hypothetical protein
MGDITPAALSHDEIISRLCGETLHIPDLTLVFAHWPSASTNPHYQALRNTVEKAITSISSTRPASQRRQNDDLALLTSLWYPAAAPDKLETLALYTVWLVCWDDEVDANEGDLAGDFAKAEAWRNETVQVLKTALGLSKDAAVFGVQDQLHNIISTVGKELQESYTVDQGQHVFHKIALFVRSCATEQRLRLEKIVPDYDSYMSMRVETVGGDTLCSLIEFSHGEQALSHLGNSLARQELDKQVSILLSLLNDLLSLKKELRTECVINAVTALLTEEKDLESVVAEVVVKMKDAVGVFDRTAEGLESSLESDSARQAARRYVDGCRSIVTGTLEFTWVSYSNLILPNPGDFDILLT